jgi:hypothetical protein
MARRASAHTKAWRVRQSLLASARRDARPPHAASPLRHCGSGRVGRAMRVVSTNFVYHRTCAKENFTLSGSMFLVPQRRTPRPPSPVRASGRVPAAPGRGARLSPSAWPRPLARAPRAPARSSAHRTSPLRLTPLDCVDRTAAGRRRGADPTELRAYVRSAAPAPRAWHTHRSPRTRGRARPMAPTQVGLIYLPSGCSRTLRPCIGRTAGQRPH